MILTASSGLCFIAFDKKDGPLTEEECEQYHLAKEKMLGNIKFIGKPCLVLVLMLLRSETGAKNSPFGRPLSRLRQQILLV